MRVVFVSLNAREPLAYGLMALGGALRRHGHEVGLVLGRSASEIVDTPAVHTADVIAMSATTGMHRQYLGWARRLRARHPEKIIVMGGPHPTFFPEVIHQAPLDGICRGEGEESFPEYLETATGTTPREAPSGWWIRRDRGRGAVIRGPSRGPPARLDSLPQPAWDMFYDADARYRRLPIRIFLPTRGCPYRCTYCFNRTSSDHNRRWGAVLRSQDPERLVDEIQTVRRRWGCRLVWFLDTNLPAHRRWFEAFTDTYRRRLDLPFFCKLRPERATARTVRRLVEAGCTGVGVGIETGVERLRRGVLGRRASDEDILRGIRTLKAHGIRVLAFNMLGIPGEGMEDALRTLAFNVACEVDYAGASILQPYPGTEIARHVVREGLFDGDFDSLSYSYFDPSPLEFPDPRHRRRLTSLQRIFSLAAEFPEVRRHVRRLVDLPPTRLHDHVFLARHERAMIRTFYHGFERTRPVDAGRPEDLDRALDGLGLHRLAKPERSD